MANEILHSSLIRIGYDAGLNEKGEAIIKRKSYSNVKTQATPEQIFQAATAIASLQLFPVTEVTRQDTALITG